MRFHVALATASMLVLSACTAQSTAQTASSSGTADVLAPDMATTLDVASPDGRDSFSLSDEGGQLRYTVSRNGEEIVGSSRLGLRFLGEHSLDANLKIVGESRSETDSTWEQPWGERRVVRDTHKALTVEVERIDTGRRGFIDIKMFDDGLGFRYRVPNSGDVAVIDELTEFNIGPETNSWTIPARMYNRYEYLYAEKPVGQLQLVHTPATFEKESSVHLSIHEAALVNYSAMSLEQNREGVLEADLSPRSDGVKVRLDGDILTPWRTIQISDDAAGLVNSDLILNLNEPNKLGDVSWVEPGKYAGIWWEQHIREGTWGNTPAPNRHAATTEATKAKIDFAAKYGFNGVLVEGWNTGWDGDWFNNGDVFSFTETYDDYDMPALAQYARDKGTRLIGHHETSGNITNYENQLADALDLMESSGVRAIKTGYVADAGNIKRVDENGVAHYEYHDSQALVDHHLKVVKEAAKRQIAINAHEPVKDTGLRRTYPNWVSREGARGQEFNAWGVPPNGPDHALDLIYTRMLSGPMDYTAGAFNLRPNEMEPVGEDLLRNSPASRIEHTLAKELSLYVALYSPIQMVMDLERNYEARPDAFQFILDVPTDWEESLALDGEVGDFAVIARRDRNSEDWYLAALTDATARDVSIDLSFLGDGDYEAQIYRDGAEADYESDPYDIVIENRTVSSADKMELSLGRSGGAAIRFLKLDNE
ncbi:glycoside hydrolase family 97 protein [Litorimonas sp. WD9-15]|uniref:glycoside hydrolase family 97 protein n=1 Tax=Litorimonas sp. WD9-15 TaxID=3418716 RepID=UPI003D031434